MELLYNGGYRFQKSDSGFTMTLSVGFHWVVTVSSKKLDTIIGL